MTTPNEMSERIAAGLSSTIPALPVRDIDAALSCYRDRFGFEVLYREGGFATVGRDNVELHLWVAADDEWPTRTDFTERPISSGAESFLAGTASCRIEVEDVDGLFEELKPKGVLHKVSEGGAGDSHFGTREFATVDVDGNLLTFFRWQES